MCIDLYINMHVHVCMHVTKFSGKKAMHLKESMKGCMEGLERGNGREK